MTEGIHGAKIRDVSCAIADPLIPWRPLRHFEILQFSFEPFTAERHVVRVIGRLRHGNREGHPPVGKTSAHSERHQEESVPHYHRLQPGTANDPMRVVEEVAPLFR